MIKLSLKYLLPAAAILLSACQTQPVKEQTDTRKNAHASLTLPRKAGFSEEQIRVGHGNAFSRFFTADEANRKAIQQHDKAVHILTPTFLRDPYIMLGPDGYYYFTSTRLDRILGGGKYDYENEGVEIWRSRNLADWELLGVPHRLKDTAWLDQLKARASKRPHNEGNPLLWAPEIHHINNQWYITHTTNSQRANLLVADNVMGPYKELFAPEGFGHRHDPTLFQDDDNRNYLLYAATTIVEMNQDFSSFVSKQKNLQPKDRKIGHEGTYLIKVDGTYVMFGTAWSTDSMRKGSYNLYYATAKNIMGPYSERKWVGRFLGHGTPFKDKQGRWWMTAFQNGKYVPFETLQKDPKQNDTAYTMTPNGAYLVPFDIFKGQSGDIEFKIKDPRFATPGPEEVQQF